MAHDTDPAWIDDPTLSVTLAEVRASVELMRAHARRARELAAVLPARAKGKREATLAGMTEGRP